MKVTTEPSNECRRLLEENMNWTPGCLGELKFTGPVFKSPSRPEDHVTNHNEKIRAFYKMCCKDGGRKIKDPLPESELQFWGDAMVAVEKNYVGRGRKPIAEMPMSISDQREFPFSVSFGEMMRRTRIQYTRALFCKNKNTVHLKESGWNFWEKVMQNLDARYAKAPEKTQPFEWKTSRASGKVDAQRQQVKWTEEILRAFHVPSILLYGPCDTVPKTEADLLAAKVSELESENEILKGKVKAAETGRLDTQETLRVFLEDVDGFLMYKWATRNGRAWEIELRKLAGLSE